MLHIAKGHNSNIIRLVIFLSITFYVNTTHADRTLSFNKIDKHVRLIQLKTLFLNNALDEIFNLNRIKLTIDATTKAYDKENKIEKTKSNTAHIKHEPSTFILFILGALSLLIARRLKK